MEPLDVAPQDPRNIKKIYLSWKDVNDYIIQLHKFLLSSTINVDCIVTPHKGGLIPATMLSYRLKVSDIFVLKVRGTTVIYPKDIMDLHMKHVLVVDNIIERGEDVLYMLQFLQNLQTQSIVVASLLQKETESPLVKPVFSAKTVPKETWAIFPWEELDY